MMMRSIKKMIRIRITGEMSIPPRFGKMLRIGRSTGSVGSCGFGRVARGTQPAMIAAKF